MVLVGYFSTLTRKIEGNHWFVHQSNGTRERNEKCQLHEVLGCPK